jgi:hypothetical protein
MDVGDVGAAGSAGAVVDPENPELFNFDVIGSGAGIQNVEDEFYYTFKKVSRENNTLTITAKIESAEDVPSDTPSLKGKMGVMIRESLDPSSKQAMVVWDAAIGTVELGHREVNQNPMQSHWSAVGIQLPCWVRLVMTPNLDDRTESHVWGSWKKNLNDPDWEYLDDDPIVLKNFILDEDVLAGLCVTSDDSGKLCRAIFSNVQVTDQ